MTTTYNVSYSQLVTATVQIPEDLAEDRTLADVIGTCREYEASATLYDEAGFVRGWVHPDGTYRLQ